MHLALSYMQLGHLQAIYYQVANVPTFLTDD